MQVNVWERMTTVVRSVRGAESCHSQVATKKVTLRGK